VYPRYQLSLYPLLQGTPCKFTADTLLSTTGYHIDEEELLVEVKGLEEGVGADIIEEGDN
jgi:hypothetical protein